MFEPHQTYGLTVPAKQALRALIDCKVIRTRFDHPGLLELYDEGLADCTEVRGDDEALDWRLA